MVSPEKELEHFMRGLKKRNPHEEEFHQAVEEVATSVMPWYLDHEKYRKAQILERLTEPDRIVSFRVSWQKDDGDIRANRAFQRGRCCGQRVGTEPEFNAYQLVP